MGPPGPSAWKSNQFDGTFFLGGFVGIGTSLPTCGIEIVQVAATPAAFNRVGDDGPLVRLLQDDMPFGTITVHDGWIAYNAFSGSVFGTGAAQRLLEPYTVVRMTGRNEFRHRQPLSRAIVGVERTSVANDPMALGAFLGLEDPALPASKDNPDLIITAGVGEVLVVGTGGPIRVGDYLITSDTPGALMKDDPTRFPVGYVIARALEDFDGGGTPQAGAATGRKRINVCFMHFVRPPMPNVERAAAPPDPAAASERATLVAEQAQEIAALRDEIADLRAALTEVRALTERLRRDEEPVRHATATRQD